MSMEFLIPLQRDDLLKRTGVNQYVVDEVFSIRVLPSRLQESRTNLRSKGATSIIQDFDTYYSILKHFNDVAPELKEDAWETLLKAMQGLIQHLTDLLEHELDKDVRINHLNTVKMLCYLVCQFIELFEAESTANSTVMKGRKPKKSHVGSMDWDYERECGVRVLSQLVKVNIHRLWDPPVLEDEFVSLMTGCCYKLLENPMGVRGKVTRDHMFHLLGVFIKKYNHGFSCSLKMIQLLQHFEHLISPLAGAVQLFVEEFGMKSIVSELMREMGRMDLEGLARDLSGTRSYSVFLVELSEKVPAAMLSNISLVLHFLDEEPYTMRNAVLGILGELVIQVLNKDDIEPKLKETRNQFLDNLEDHIYDTNAFVRNKTIQVWGHIVNSGAMPLSRLHKVLESVVGRLKDKSSQVRKSAMQFTTASLQSNPFAAKLSRDELMESYEKESAKLKEMLPEHDDTVHVKQEVSPECEFWATIEHQVKEAISCIIQDPSDSTTSSVEIAEEDTVPVIVDKISGLVKEHAYKDAVRLLQAAHEAFSVEPTFNYDVEQGDTEPEDPHDDRNDEANVKLRGMLGCIQDIMLGQQHLAAMQNVVGSQGDVVITGEESPKVANEITKQQVLVKYLQDSMKFVQEIQNSIPVICQLLGSKTMSDVMEAINFFVMGYEFGITNAIVGVRTMLSRIWASEAPIKEAVVGAYKRLYLKSQGRDARTRAVNVVANLSPLTVGASIGDMTSLEELICEFVRSGEMGKHETQVMWERFTMKIPNTNEGESSAALMLLSMAAGADPAIVKSNINVLVKEGLGPRAEKDFILPRFTCVALLKIAGTNKPKAGTYEEPFRLPINHDIFKRLSTILVNGAKLAENDQWIPLGAQGVNVIFRLAEKPDAICGDMMKQLAREIMTSQGPVTDTGDGSGDNGTGVTNPQCNNALLTRFLFLSGQIGFAQLIHLDTSVFCELKRRSNIQEEGKQAACKEKSASKTPSRNKSEGELTAEEEMGLAGATADDAEAEYIRRICEAEIVTGNNLIGVLRPFVLSILNNPTKFTDSDLQAAAAMALAKFMMVSSEFCESHLQLLFTILEKSPHAVIRANSIIALGDLTVRFPNLIEPWTPHLYKRLRDPSSQVRKNTVQVLTHLILKNMLKVKGHISEMATCIVDHNDRISGLAKLFFHELAKKGNAVYNVMPDIISRLSDPDAGVDEEHFQIIMKYLFSFIQKDRQCESLVEKLCHRFRAARVDRQSSDLAFCLSLLSYNEKSLRKLQENFACFADKLGDVQIYQYFLTILSGAKKFMKQQSKTLIEELEQRMEQCHTKGAEEADIAHKAKGAMYAAKSKKGTRTPRRSPGKTPSKTPGKTPGRRGRAKTLLQQMQEEMDADSESEEPHPVRRGDKRQPQLQFSSDDEEDDVFQEPKGKAPLSKNGEGINDVENHDPNVDKGGGKKQAADDNRHAKQVQNPAESSAKPVLETSESKTRAVRGKVQSNAEPVKDEDPPTIKKTRHKSVSNKAAVTHTPPPRRNATRKSSRKQ